MPLNASDARCRRTNKRTTRGTNAATSSLRTGCCGSGYCREYRWHSCSRYTSVGFRSPSQLVVIESLPSAVHRDATLDEMQVSNSSFYSTQNRFIILSRRVTLAKDVSSALRLSLSSCETQFPAA